VELQVALQLFTLEQQSPGDEACGHGRHGRDRGGDQVVICGGGKPQVALPSADKVEQQAGDEQRNREMDDNHVLRMFREHRGLQAKRIHSLLQNFHSLHDDLSGHHRMN